MSDNARRSTRVNKGVPPNRYKPYNTEQRSRSPDSEMSTTPPSSEERDEFSSADELDKTIVSAEQSTPPGRPPTTVLMHGDGTLPLISSQQPTILTQPRAGAPHTARSPLFDPQQIREPLGPNGLSSSADTRPPACPLPEAVVFTPVAYTSTSYDSRRQWAPTERQHNDVLPHHRSPLIAGAPPPFHQSDWNTHRLDGLPPPASTSQPSCSHHAGVQLQSGAPQQHGPPFPHGQPTASTTHHPSSAAEYLASIRELRGQILTLQREKQQFRELNSILRLSNETYQKVISGGSFGSGNNSRLSSEFAGFEQSTSQGQQFRASTAYDSEPQLGETPQRQAIPPATATMHAQPSTSTAATAAAAEQLMFNGFGEPASSHVFTSAAAHTLHYDATDRRANEGGIATQFQALAMTAQHGGPATPAPAPHMPTVVAAPLAVADAGATRNAYAVSTNAPAVHPYHGQTVVFPNQQAFQPAKSTYTQPVQYLPACNTAPPQMVAGPTFAHTSGNHSSAPGNPPQPQAVNDHTSNNNMPQMMQPSFAPRVHDTQATAYVQLMPGEQFGLRTSIAASQSYAGAAPRMQPMMPGPSYVPCAHRNDTQAATNQQIPQPAPMISVPAPAPAQVVAATAPVQPVAAYYVDAYHAASASTGNSAQSSNYATASNGGEAWRPWQAPQTGERGAGYPSGAAAPNHPQVPVAPYRRTLQDLPSFNGSPEDWPHFICAYESTTRQFGLSDLDNLGRLQKALSGDAKKRVRGILVRPEHVGRTVETLARAFGRPDILLESQLEEITKIPRIGENRLNEIVSYSITVDSLVSFLDGPSTHHLLESYLLLKELTSKLPTSDQRVWSGVARRIGPNPSIRDFAQWLADAADDISNMKMKRFPDGAAARSRETKPAQPKGKHVLLNVASRTPDGRAEKCVFCGEAHNIEQCATFKLLSVKQRFFETRRRPLCYMCLGQGHLLPSCDKIKMCGLDGCTRRHHHLLHEPSRQVQGAQDAGDGDRRPAPQGQDTTATSKQQPQRSKAARPPKAGVSKKPQTTQPQPINDAAPVSAVLSCQGGRPRQTLYYRVLPVVLHGPNSSRQTYALLDEGSSVSLIDADLAAQLQLEGELHTLNLQFVSGAATTQTSRKVSMGISGVEADAVRYDIDTVQTTNELSLPVQTVARDEVLSNNPHLTDIPFATFENVRPQILLGLEHHYLGVPTETRSSEQLRSIAAARTKLGWVLYGSSGQSALPGAVVLHARQPEEEADVEAERLGLLHELVRQHFTTEDFGVKASTEPILSENDKRAYSILESTTRRSGNRFETGLLWKRDDIFLPDSYHMALNRLRSVESKMRRDPEYARQYREQIRAYVEKGYARRMTPSEANKRGPRTWYLPHFAVQSASKPGKFRLVFDAAATSHNISLNAMLLAGPDLNVPLTRLLFRFRLGPVGVCADVKEMFHQVRVRKEDQDAQRFLWRDGSETDEPSVYVMVAMTFGSTCSPTSAQFVKNRNAQEFVNQFPEAAAAVQQNHYVDDYVASFRSTEDAQRVTAEVIDLHKRGGFDLRGVVSNCRIVRERFQASTETPSAVCLEPEDLTQKILGMTWETEDDSFVFQTRFHRVNPSVMDGSRRPTKRELLSFVMSIFDPFGLLANFLLPSKCMLQELWRLGVKWDEPVPDQIDTRWQAWRSQVEQTRRMRIPRCYSPSILDAPGLQLHVFADASEEAFAAVAYWRIEGEERIELAFIAGKVRCAPLKLFSIPRLELQAAILATRLMLEIRQSHEELTISKIVFWSDSETVLKWLRCDQRRYVPFVAHRVAEVVDSAPADLWRWVPTALNVADDATRVRTQTVFDPESRWLHGPTWLSEDESTWPLQPSYNSSGDAATEELRPKFVGTVSQRGAVEYEKFSSFSHLVRLIALVRRFTTNARAERDVRKKGGITAMETERAIETVCRMVQNEVYEDDVGALSSGRPLSSRSRLFVLKPYLDDFGLLRVHGRTDAAREEVMSNAAKRPIIMPRTHHVTMLIARQHHELFAHQLTDATIASIRTKFWVPQIRTLVKSVRHACQTCRIRSAKPTPPSQGQLPADRLNAYARPFTHTGLDFFGPYHVAVGRRREKRWVALFTCMAVRAVHLEVAADLSTDACLVCLRNFCHLRGVPAMIRCDNGTNFVGAKNELDRHADFFDSDAIQRELAGRGVEWKLNCPGNPEAGGAWERLVQSVKRVLAVTLQEQAPRVETFRALLLEAANAVNSRPLTHLQVDPADPEPLTPNHFLLGGPNVATAPNPEDIEPTATRRQWQVCRGLSRRFWRQFVRDYLPELTRRSKHYPVVPQLRQGDIVIVCDEQLMGRKWTRGIITEVVTAADGVVRTATVRTATGSYRRPVTKLARLDVSPPDSIGVRGAVSRSESAAEENTPEINATSPADL